MCLNPLREDPASQDRPTATSLLVGANAAYDGVLDVSSTSRPPHLQRPSLTFGDVAGVFGPSSLQGLNDSSHRSAGYH